MLTFSQSDSGKKVMSLRPIKSVIIEYEDDSTEIFVIDGNMTSGYHRNSYTWEAKPEGQGLAKWGGRVETHEVFWTERKGLEDERSETGAQSR